MFRVKQMVEKRKNSVALWWEKLYRYYIQSATESSEKKEQRGFVVGRNCTDVILRVQES
jgi:hypothetical protein